MENNNCILLTKKEYKELCDQAYKNKPTELIVQYMLNEGYVWGSNLRFGGNLDISANIRMKIRSILELFKKSMDDDFINKKRVMISYGYKEYKKLSLFKRAFLKEEDFKQLFEK